MEANDYHDVGWADIDDVDRELRPASLIRTGLDEEAVERYRTAMTAPGFPAVKLTYDFENKIHWVDDGAHTITAAIREGRTKVKALVRNGNFRDAFHAACRWNETHGVPRRDADKRHAVEQFLRSVPGAMDMKQEMIADICNVTHQYVSKIKCSFATSCKAAPSEGGVRLTPSERAVEGAYAANPAATVAEVAASTGISPRTIVVARKKLGLARATPRVMAPGRSRDGPAAGRQATIPFIAECHWDEAEAGLEAILGLWPRSEWARFFILCRGWAERRAREAGITLYRDPTSEEFAHDPAV